MNDDTVTETASEPAQESKKSTKRDNLVRLSQANLEKRDPATDKTAVAALAEITAAHAGYKKAQADKARISTECKQRIESENAAFTEAIEAPLKPNASRGQVLSKLTNVENRWQELSDAKARNIEDRRAAKEEIKTSLERLDKAIVESGQLALQGVA